MEKIYFVSSNPGKINEVMSHLKKFGIEVIGKEMELQELNSEDQIKISSEKAKAAAKIIGKPLIVEDTAVYFEAYRNFPGTHPKFIYKTIGFEGIFKLLEGKTRIALIKTVVSYCEPGKEPRIFSGTCKGRITEKVIEPAEEKLPFDAIFIPDGDNRTFSQMSKEEKAMYSHRAKALNEFAKWFTK